MEGWKKGRKYVLVILKRPERPGEELGWGKSCSAPEQDICNALHNPWENKSSEERLFDFCVTLFLKNSLILISSALVPSISFFSVRRGSTLQVCSLLGGINLENIRQLWRNLMRKKKLLWSPLTTLINEFSIAVWHLAPSEEQITCTN